MDEREKAKLFKRIRKGIRKLSAFEVRCRHCRARSSQLDRFCESCGTANPVFSFREFAAYHREPFKATKARHCRDDHRVEKEGIYDAAPCYRPRYCRFCGAPFPLVPTQEPQGTH